MYFGTTGNHYNWRIAAQEIVDAGFEIAVGSQDTDYSNDTYTQIFNIKNTGNATFSGSVTATGADFNGVVDISAGTNLNLSVRQLAFDNFSNEGVGITFSRTSSDSDLMAIGVVDTSKLNIASRSGLIFSTGGGVQYGATSEVMRIDSSGKLFVGDGSPQWPIGTLGNTAGRHMFHHNGDTVLLLWDESTGAQGNTGQLFLGGKPVGSSNYFSGGAIYGRVENGSNAAGDLAFLTTNTSGGVASALVLDSSQNATFANSVGIGTGPGFPLHVSSSANVPAVVDSSANETYVYIRNSNAATGRKAYLAFAPANNIHGAAIYAEAMEDFSTSANRTADLVFETRNNGTIDQHMWIKANGDVGVGTSSVFGATSNRRCLSVNGTSSTSLNIGVGGAQKGYLYSDGNLAQIGSIGNIPLKFASDDTPRMMLLGTGQFAVNDTGTSAHQMKLTSSTMGLRIKAGTGGYTALSFSGDGENTIGAITTTTNQILIGSQNSAGTGSNGELLVEPRSGSNKRVLTLKSTGNIHGPINAGPKSFAGLGCFNIMDMEREWLDLLAANSGSDVTSHTSTSNVQGPSMSHPGATNNGYSKLKYADHPHGGVGVVLESTAGNASTWNGGWNSGSFAVDRHKPYLYTCYVRRTSSASAGNFYFGLYNAYPQGTSTTVNTNPYFIATSTSVFNQINVWYLVYCMVYPREYNGTGLNPYAPGDLRGIWRLDNMDRRSGVTGWRHYQDFQQMRSYLYYAGDSATTLQWARPGVWVMDGNQPTFGDLINAHGIHTLKN